MNIATRRLADICSMQTGKLNSNAAEPNGIFPFFTCAQETYRINKAAFNTEAVLLGGNNANGIFPLKYYNGKFNAYQRTYVIETLDNNVLDTRYLFYALRPALSTFQAASIGAATQYLTKSILDNFKIGVPDVDVQKRIVHLLSSYDDLIQNNRRRIALLERAAREIYREWFVRLRFPGHEDTKIIDGVPEGWDRVHLSEVVSTQYGYTASANDEPVGPKFLRGTDINKQSYIDWSTVPYCPGSGLNFEKYALRRGDLLVIRMADPGKVAIVEKETKAIFASYLVRLLVRTDSGIDPLYLFYVLADAEYQGFIRAASGGSTRKSASAKLLTDFRVLRPPKNVQDIFVDQIRPLREMIGTLLEQISKANLSRDLLLPRLMDGRIRV